MAAEMRPDTRLDAAADQASMRPRRMAAEIRPASPATRRSTRFNEAAANGRGNSPVFAATFIVMTASMRPRRMAAEMRRGQPVGRPQPVLQ